MFENIVMDKVQISIDVFTAFSIIGAVVLGSIKINKIKKEEKIRFSKEKIERSSAIIIQHLASHIVKLNEIIAEFEKSKNPDINQIISAVSFFKVYIDTTAVSIFKNLSEEIPEANQKIDACSNFSTEVVDWNKGILKAYKDQDPSLVKYKEPGEIVGRLVAKLLQ